jgi:hypothetical protein
MKTILRILALALITAALLLFSSCSTKLTINNREVRSPIRKVRADESQLYFFALLVGVATGLHFKKD